MIIDDLDLVGIGILPAETDPPLVIHPDAMLPRPIALELLEPIAGRDAEVLERLRGVEGNQLPEHDSAELGGIAPDRLALEQTRRVPIAEGLDHTLERNATRY